MCLTHVFLLAGMGRQSQAGKTVLKRADTSWSASVSKVRPRPCQNDLILRQLGSTILYILRSGGRKDLSLRHVQEVARGSNAISSESIYTADHLARTVKASI